MEFYILLEKLQVHLVVYHSWDNNSGIEFNSAAWCYDRTDSDRKPVPKKSIDESSQSRVSRPTATESI